MKILVLSHISELLGGAERSMLDLMDNWKVHYDIQPEFILREPIKSLAPAIKKRGWKYHALDYTFWSDGNPPKNIDTVIQYAKRNQKAVSAIEKIIQTTKPDAVITNSIVCPWAAIAAFNSDKPHIWIVREYGDLDHGRIYEIGRDKTYQDVNTLSALVVANSTTLADYLKKHINPNKVTALYNPFDLNEITKNASKKIANPYKNKDALKLVITGNLAASKGQHEAVEATLMLNKRGHNVELCLIGKDGDLNYMKQIHKLVNNNHGNKIHFLGYQSNPLAFVNHADVCITSSRKEAFGRVTFEYLVLGKAVVGANSGATPEMVKNGKNGYLYEYGNVKSLASALENYVENKSLLIEHGSESKNIAKSMMAGEFNAAALYKRVSQIANSKRSKVVNEINYLKYWDELLKNYQVDNNSRSLSKRAGDKIYSRAKVVYRKTRSLKTKVLGK